MAQWDTAYINNLPDSAFAVILPGGTKDGEGKTVPRDLRKLPHHDASGAVDLPHLRNALSRAPQANLTAAQEQKAEAHLDAHLAAEGKALVAVKATLIDDDAFRLLALPYGGPIPYPGAPRGVDIDRQWFSEATDFGDIPKRVPVTWHHGLDGKMGKAQLGEAVDPEEDEDGVWVKVWMNHGERRVNLISRLAEQGSRIFGSSEAYPGRSRIRAGKAEIPWSRSIPGEITRWHYIGQTLSTSPQNTNSILRPMKATLDDLASGQIAATDAFFSDLSAFLDNLGTRPDTDLTSEVAAKAGRVLASRNEERLRKALAEMSAVLEELDKYVHTTEEQP